MSDPQIETLTVPGHVAAGELIESAWGNNVVDTFNAIEISIQVFRGGIKHGSSVVTPDAGGQIAIPFGSAFPAVPIVLAQLADPSVAAGATSILVNWPASSTTGFAAVILKHDGSAATTVQRVNWVAVYWPQL